MESEKDELPSTDEIPLTAESKAAEIVSDLIIPNMTEFEKALILHEYMTGRMTYGKYNGETSAYTALLHNQADCVGFTRGLTLLYTTAGLDAFAVQRQKGHLWVKVKIGQEYYNVDPTWCNLKSNWPQYGWFLLSDDQNVDGSKGVSHVLDSNESYPKAPGPFVFRKSDFPCRGACSLINPFRPGKAV